MSDKEIDLYFDIKDAYDLLKKGRLYRKYYLILKLKRTHMGKYTQKSVSLNPEMLAVATSQWWNCGDSFLPFYIFWQ